jgi:hypothetical protein
MTLIVGLTGPESVWMLADRKLTFYDGREPRNDARKILLLRTEDGRAILGYAGLGITGMGNEPSDWMSAVLRGRNYPLERALGTLALAAAAQLPRHLTAIGQPHAILIPAFLLDQPRLYTIGIDAGGQAQFHFHGKNAAGRLRATRIGLAGSGSRELLRDKTWMRPLLKLLRRVDNGSIRPQILSDLLAGLNHRVNLVDKTVSDECIVAWQYRDGGALGGGGGQQFYAGTRRLDSPGLPTIWNGRDMTALVEVIMKHSLPSIQKQLASEPSGPVDIEKLNTELARLPDQPDEKLL